MVDRSSHGKIQSDTSSHGHNKNLIIIHGRSINLEYNKCRLFLFSLEVAFIKKTICSNKKYKWWVHFSIVNYNMFKITLLFSQNYTAVMSSYIIFQ